MLRTLKTVMRQDKEKFKIPKSVQQVIPIQTIWKDGIFLVGKNKYAKTYRFTDINFEVASEEDKKSMFLDYTSILNFFDCGATTKLTIIIRRLNKEELKEAVFIPMQEDGLDKYRKEVNDMLMEKTVGANGMVRELYVTISVYRKNVEDARNYFLRTGNGLISHFSNLGSKCEELDAQEKLHVLHSFYRAGEESHFSFDMKTSAKLGQPEIVELFRVLEGNGLKKEQKEVESLVKYLDGMESQFGQVLEELRDVKEQLSQIQDGGVKASVLRIAEQAQGKVQEVGGQFHTVRKNLIQFAKSALQTFKEKGKDALQRAVSAMKIPSALARMQEGLHGAVESMNRQADKMEVLSGELHATGGHIKNVGRIFRGKEREKVESQATDRGITAKIRKSFLTISGRLSSMEQTTDNVRKRLEQFVQKKEKKPSVKGELKKLKEEKKMVPQLPVPVKQQARE